jgi:hypothetical protein
MYLSTGIGHNSVNEVLSLQTGLYSPLNHALYKRVDADV